MSPPPLSDRVPRVMAGIIGKCLEKEPERRYQRAGEVRSALQTSDVAAGAAPTQQRARLSRALTKTAAVGLTAAVAIAAAFDVGGIREWAGSLVSEDVIAFGERDWLLVSNFENQTADPVFDKSLDTALAVGIEPISLRERRADVADSSRLAADEDSGGESDRWDDGSWIAQRENLKLVLVPSIAEIGDVSRCPGSLGIR